MKKIILGCAVVLLVVLSAVFAVAGTIPSLPAPATNATGTENAEAWASGPLISENNCARPSILAITATITFDMITCSADANKASPGTENVLRFRKDGVMTMTYVEVQATVDKKYSHYFASTGANKVIYCS
ncbi:hypothetical protein HY227_02010 [Candidatus Wolfebacteria bacterium]|nr:hypothetical protein [Candidatus Wolfebacteria bacterium]